MYDWHFKPDAADIAANNGYDLSVKGGEAYKTESQAIWHGKRMVLDFDWMLPATSENRDKILVEIIRRANEE